MPVLRILITAVVLAAVVCGTAVAASLPVNQRFTDRADKVSLLTRAGGKGYVTARTRCGRFADRRVRIARGRITLAEGRAPPDHRGRDVALDAAPDDPARGVRCDARAEARHRAAVATRAQGGSPCIGRPAKPRETVWTNS